MSSLQSPRFQIYIPFSLSPFLPSPSGWGSSSLAHHHQFLLFWWSLFFLSLPPYSGSSSLISLVTNIDSERERRLFPVQSSSVYKLRKVPPASWALCLNFCPFSRFLVSLFFPFFLSFSRFLLLSLSHLLINVTTISAPYFYFSLTCRH